MLKAVFVTSGARVYSVAVSMIALVLTARWLGPEGRGAAVVLVTWANLFASVGYLSLGQACLHRASVDRDLTWLGEAVGALLVMTLVATGLGWVVVALLWLLDGEAIFGTGDMTLALLAFAGLPFLIWEQYNSALLTMVGRLKVYNINQLVGRSVTLILLAATILAFGWGVHGFLVATLVGQAIVAMAGMGILLRRAGNVRTSLPAIGRLVSNGAKLHLNAIGVLLFSSADILMIQYFRGAAEAGIFQFASQIFMALLIVPQAALLVLNGRLTALEPPAFWREHKRMIGIIMGLMAVAAIVLALLANWIVPLVATPAFAQSGRILQIFCLGSIAATLNTMMGLQWIVQGRFLASSFLTLATGVGNCLLNLFLIPRFGAIGAAWATVIGIYMIPFTTNLILMHRTNRRWSEAQ